MNQSHGATQPIQTLGGNSVRNLKKVTQKVYGELKVSTTEEDRKQHLLEELAKHGLFKPLILTKDMLIMNLTMNTMTSTDQMQTTAETPKPLEILFGATLQMRR